MHTQTAALPSTNALDIEPDSELAEFERAARSFGTTDIIAVFLPWLPALRKPAAVKQ